MPKVWVTCMDRFALNLVLGVLIWAVTQFGPVAANAAEWVRYMSPLATLSVDLPTDVFTVDTGPTNENAGHSFKTDDGRADFSVYSKPNHPAISPNAFLGRYFELPRSSIDGGFGRGDHQSEHAE